MTASIEAIRAQFPALDREHGGHRVAYFDGPGGTQVPRRVVDAMTEYLYRHNANTHWEYPSSAETDEIIAAAREALADFVGATPREIAFGANMTTLAFHVARGLARGWDAGDEIVITELDHHANVAPWQAVARDHGLTLRCVRLRVADGTLDLDDLHRSLGPRTRLLAIGAASNALGTISDVAAAAAAAHDAGALVFVDAVHYAPHVLADVRALGADLLACSAYKFYGPHVGALYVRGDLAETIDVPKLEPAPDEVPARFETGTLDHEGIAGASAAVEFLASVGDGADRRARLRSAFDMLHQRGSTLVERLWRGLERIPGVTLYGREPGAARTPTVAFTIRAVASSSAARALAAEGIFVSHGDFYAKTVIERLGVGAEGLIRAGCACYTTEEEVDRLIAGVARIARVS